MNGGQDIWEAWAAGRYLIGAVLTLVLGLGPLEPLLQDQTITDILVNGHDTVFVERGGLLERVATRFQDEKHLLRIIQKIDGQPCQRAFNGNHQTRDSSHRAKWWDEYFAL